MEDPFSLIIQDSVGHDLVGANVSQHHHHILAEEDLIFYGKEADDDDPVTWVYKINSLKRWVEIVAAIFMVLTCALMGNQIGLHLTYNTHPAFRTYTVRILLMVPIYSITSYAGLHNPSNAITWALIRDGYECVVLFSFLQYCLTYLGGPENIARYLIARQHDEAATLQTLQALKEVKHGGVIGDKSATQSLLHAEDVEMDLPGEEDGEEEDEVEEVVVGADGKTNVETKKIPWQKRMCGKKKKKVLTHVKHPPCCWLCCPCCPVWRPCKGQLTRPWALGAEFLRLTIVGTLQYIPFSICVMITGVVGKLNGVYHEGRFTTDDVYFYNVLVRNFSQCWALYCLGLFYVILHDELHAIRPVAKFVVIKIVVILMWDQQVLVAALEKSPYMKEADDGLIKRGWTSTEVGFCIINFLCIIEMFFIGCAFHYAFHYTEWATDEVREQQGKVGPFGAFWASKTVTTVKDIVHDTKELGKATAMGVRYVVKKDTWKKFGSALTTRNASAAPPPPKVHDSKEGFTKLPGSDEEAGAEELNSGQDAKKLHFVTLPRLMTSKEIFVTARFAESVTFMDVIRTMREINVLEKVLEETEPRHIYEAALKKRFGPFAQDVRAYLHMVGVEETEDLKFVDADELHADAADGGVKPVQAKKLRAWVIEVQQGTRAAPSQQAMDRREV